MGLIESFEPSCMQEHRDKEAMLFYLTAFDDLLTRKNPLLHVTVSAWTMNSRRDQVLMVFHNIYQAWSWVGGHADGDQNLISVAERELTEETGLKEFRLMMPTPLSLEIIGVQGHEKRGTYVSSHLHLNVTYFFEAPQHQPLKVKPDENIGVAWRDVATVQKDPTEKHMQKIYQKLLRRVDAMS
ncbi:MAG TPA: NUDIX hydrolase [Clostridiales bacterium]|nr:NUDIX hydrolase [Clostridiales bacterium]